MADRVMRMADPGPLPAMPVSGALQRACSDCEEELQRKPGDHAGRALRAAPDKSGVDTDPGGGQPLPGAVRAFFEPRFGYDFSRVRIHTGPHADQAARSVDALAFTLGQNIVFRAEQYAPGSVQGKRLLAHELTHIIQQNGPQPERHGISGRSRIRQRFAAPATIGLQANRGLLQRQANADRCTYGEIRSWAITSQSNLTAPGGLANAKASVAAACGRGNPCSCVDGSQATAPGDQAAWRNIVAATGGTDQTGGGNFMCVGTQNCWFVSSCDRCTDGRRTRVARTANLAPSGSTVVTGKGTLYFYNDPLRGWCNQEDYRSGCRTRGRGRRAEAGEGEAGPLLQAKLNISQPGDLYEREADRMVDQVLSQTETAPATSAPPGILTWHTQPAALIQRSDGSQLTEPRLRLQPPAFRLTRTGGRYFRVYFDQGMYLLPRLGELEKIETVSQTLLQDPSLEVIVEGHASEEGTAEVNQRISESRATSIKMMLIERGISESRIHTLARGETEPAVQETATSPRALEEQRQQNRRVEIAIVSGSFTPTTPSPRPIRLTLTDEELRRIIEDPSRSREQRDLARILREMGAPDAGGPGGLQDLAERIKRRIELRAGDYVISPDLGTILSGLRSLLGL